MKSPLLSALCVLLLLVPSVGAAEEALDVEKVLAEMASKGSAFDPSPLHKRGKEGLSLLLDRLLPDTLERSGPPATEKEIRDLLKKLDDDNAKVRQTATDRLIRAGRPFRILVEEAARSGDADLKLRALVVLRAWKPPDIDVQPYAEAFTLYTTGIKDRERLELLARRTLQAFESGMPEGGRLALLRGALRGVSRAGEDRYGKIFEPVLKHKDIRVPVLVLQAIGGHGQGNTYFPQLLLDGMMSDRKEIVQAALDYSPSPCWDEKKKPELRRRITRIFRGDDDDLKLRTSFTLMHGFGDRDAFRYLLTQTKSKDQERVLTAMAWIGDACHYGTKITDEVLNTLTPFLRSPDERLRRSAVNALAVYDGEAVVKALIPMLGDPVPIIAEETTSRLPDQKDKAMLRRLLKDAAEKGTNPRLRGRARAVLDRIAEK